MVLKIKLLEGYIWIDFSSKTAKFCYDFVSPWHRITGETFEFYSGSQSLMFLEKMKLVLAYGGENFQAKR